MPMPMFRFTSSTSTRTSLRAVALTLLLGCGAGSAQANDERERSYRADRAAPQHTPAHVRERDDDRDEHAVRHDGVGDRYDSGHNHRQHDGHRGWGSDWWTVATLRTHRDGRGEDFLRLPPGTRAIRLAAVERRTDIVAVYLERANGREERLYALEGRLDGRGPVIARLHRPLRGPARLHIVHAPAREGRRAVFDLLAVR